MWPRPFLTSVLVLAAVGTIAVAAVFLLVLAVTIAGLVLAVTIAGLVKVFIATAAVHSGTIAIAHQGFFASWFPQDTMGPAFHLMVLSAQFTVAVLILAGVIRSFIKLFHR